MTPTPTSTPTPTPTADRMMMSKFAAALLYARAAEEMRGNPPQPRTWDGMGAWNDVDALAATLPPRVVAALESCDDATLRRVAAMR